MGRSLHGRLPKITLSLSSVLTLLLAAGCATTPYKYGGDLHTARDAGLKPGESQTERGRPAPVVDTVGWVVGVPAKIVMLDHRVDNHDVSFVTEGTLQEYLAANGLEKVKVRVNQYDPGGEWRRLLQNKSVGWPARYTLGTLSVVGYTLLPGRVFGGDQYNPYTNTINIYSDVPAIALYEGGHAKDYAQREHKGLYAAAYCVPGVGLYHDAQASDDAMSYLQAQGTTQEVKDGYRAVCPTYALRTSQPLAAFTGAPVVLPAVVAGHVVGQVKAASVHEKDPPVPLNPETGETSRPEITPTAGIEGVPVSAAFSR